MGPRDRRGALQLQVDRLHRRNRQPYREDSTLHTALSSLFSLRPREAARAVLRWMMTFTSAADGMSEGGGGTTSCGSGRSAASAPLRLSRAYLCKLVSIKLMHSVHFFLCLAELLNDARRQGASGAAAFPACVPLHHRDTSAIEDEARMGSCPSPSPVGAMYQHHTLAMIAISGFAAIALLAQVRVLPTARPSPQTTPV